MNQDLRNLELQLYVRPSSNYLKSINHCQAIKTMCHIITVPWLSLDSQKDLHRIVKQIKLNDGVAISRKDPLTNQIINKGIKDYWNIQTSSTDMLATTISLVGHDCLFRGQETFSGIQVKEESRPENCHTSHR